jgi:1-acyl-sn-glycerol-3-phosphate acyltransferase
VILFPEGTRGEPEQLGAFKSGVAHLARQHPAVPVIPVFMHGQGKSLPRGAYLPVPLFCDVFVGEALYGEADHRAFMQRLTERMRQIAGEGHFAAWD